MNVFAVACLILAGLNGLVGAFYLLFYLKLREELREYRPFSLLCVAIAAYDACAAGLYASDSLAEGIRWQKAQFVALDVVGIGTIWFLGLIAEGRLDRTLRSFIAVLALMLPIALFDGWPGITPSLSTPAIKTVEWAGRTLVTYYESEMGIVYALGMLTSYLAYLYLFRLLYRAHRRGESRHLVPIMVGQIAYFVGLLNDGLVASGVYVFIYVSEYAYLLVVGTMAYALLGKFVDLHQAVEESNRTLEQRVLEALADIKVLRGLIPICAACKKIRDDRGFWNHIEDYISQHSDASFSHAICPACIEKLYPEHAERRRDDTAAE